MTGQDAAQRGTIGEQISAWIFDELESGDSTPIEREIAVRIDAAVAEAVKEAMIPGVHEWYAKCQEQHEEIARLHVEIARLNAKDRDPGRKADLVDKARREERERIVGMLRGFNLPPGYAYAIATAIRRPPEGEK